MTYIKTTVLTLTLCAFMVQPALAKKPEWAGDHDKKSKGRSEQSYSSRSHYDGPVQLHGGNATQFIIEIEPEHREKFRSYIHSKHQKWCPPGLAKKGRHCSPPGHSKRYSVGGYVPRDYMPIPSDLAYRVGPPPHGTFYAMVDSDVLLVSEASKKIIDAVTLLSAVR